MPRGIYALEDEEAPWLKERLVFPTKAACLAWMEKHVEDKAHPSNPVVPHLNHIFTFLTSWGEVEEFLLKKIDEYDERYPPTGPLGSISPNNRFVVRNKGKAGEFDTERNGGTSPSPAAGDVGGIPQDRSQEISSSSSSSSRRGRRRGRGRCGGCCGGGGRCKDPDLIRKVITPNPYYFHHTPITPLFYLPEEPQHHRKNPGQAAV
mmetsp:Transcript_69933/g.140771  ORF Transcript_69933/g.140771 Transcript_69933/m.140771 type:complete len:206 (+) Transcript_69933:43-660(+)